MISTRLCLGIALLSGSIRAQTKCYTCQTRIDHTGKTLGLGNDNDCESGNNADLAKYEEECRSDVCMVDIQVNWIETGRQETKFIRGCTTAKTESTRCVESFDGHSGYRDCKRTCAEDNCNGKELVELMGQEGMSQAAESLQCKVCDPSDDKCDENSDDITSLECPVWADAGCFVAENDKELNDVTSRDVNRGCSAFTTTQKCRTLTITNNESVEKDTICKATCSSDACNVGGTGDILEGCYVCQYTEDTSGDVLGVSNNNCFDSQPNNEYLTQCPNPTDKCGTTVRVDWDSKGHQTVHVERGCVGENFEHQPNVEDDDHTCTGNWQRFPPPDEIYKECNSACEGSACNDQTEYKKLIDMFDHGEIESCHNCKYETDAFGNASGQKNCALFGAEGVPSKPCPEWANAACFMAGSWYSSMQGITPVELETDYRGCSAFVFAGLADGENCYAGSDGVSSYTDCKYTCDEKNDCNTKPLIKRKQCHSCTATRNMLNETVGTGDSNCFDRAELTPMEQCENEDDICRTDLEQDWDIFGEVRTSVRRGCVRKENQAGACYQQTSPNAAIKDCAVTCGTTGCNVGLVEVSEKFREGLENEVDSCHACYFSESDDGAVAGNAKCIDEPGEIGGIEIDCPLYARAGCYVGSNVHQVGKNEVEQVYRGCLFTQPAQPTYCFQQELPINGAAVSYGICKESCFSDNCNANEHIKPENPGSGWAKCQVCKVSVNERNETIGAGQDGCWDGTDYDEFCPNEDDLCETEFIIDWFPRGFHTFIVERSCRPRADSKDDKCEDGGSGNIVSYRDCLWSCDPVKDGKSCNAGMNGLPEEGKDNVVESCYFCQYSQDIDGKVQGSPGCGDFTYNKAKLDCPSYASRSCYNAASFHRDYANNGEFEDDFRGCSPFELNRQQTCINENINELDHVNCKETCYTDNCNTGVHKKRKQCYTCQSTVNSEGNVIGVGNKDCWDFVTPGMLQDCPSDDDVCLDELLADWVAKGDQTYSIRRRCSSREANEECTEGDSDKVQYKDCETSCTDSACNNDLSIADKFKSGSYQNPSCYTCRYVEDDSHNVSGNRNCEKNPASTIKSCPAYAALGCFTGSATHLGVYDDDLVVEHYKGCSAFSIENGGIISYDDDKTNSDGSVTQYNVVKSFCVGENCNNILYKPNTEIGKTLCQVCQVNVDQHNQTVGIGDDRCWEGHPSLEQNCGPNQMCITEMEIDWYARGMFNYRVKRGCSPVVEESNCYEGSSSLVKFKDCSVLCDPAKQGASCNTGLDQVSAKFSVSNGPEQCYHCSYYEDLDGTVQGDVKCGEEQKLTDLRPSLKCPTYANAACFEAASYHEDYKGNGREFEDDYRGCSPFRFDSDEQLCASQEINQLKHLNCKRTCTTTNCNFRKTDRGLLQCHSCSVTLDQLGRQVGIGDPSCVESPSTSTMVDCPESVSECSTEVIVDWLINGKQHVTIRRGCLEEQQPEQCIEGESPRVMYKDCFDKCSENGCNDNLDVADKLNQSNNKQAQCITCEYIEADNGDISGNVNCPDSPTDELQLDCPPWATAACFTGSAIHNSGGVEKEEVYKGCSTFTVPGGIQKLQKTVSNVQYSLVKESCTDGDNCNAQHTRPDPIKETGLSCYVCTITKDHLGNTVGNADESCWGDFPADYLKARCNEGDVCKTELLTDWFTKGNQVVSLVRSCGREPAEEDPVNPIVGGSCIEGATAQINFKDCISYCDTNNCNYNMDTVLDLHDSGNDISCYACQYGYGYNGEVLPNSNEACHESTINPDKVPLVKCPKYANAACFTASSFDVEGSEQAVHDYKGCSGFALDVPQCSTQSVDEDYDITYCKSTCDSNGCNDKTEAKQLSCFTCDYTFDSLNGTIGTGSSDCLYAPASDKIQFCWQDDPVCTIEFFADWGYNGQQYYRVRRGCGAKESTVAGCQSSNLIEGKVSYKDCVDTCDTSDCNNYIDEIARQFSSGNDQDSCYACTYIERDDGTVQGNKFCADAPDKLPGSAKINCPMYADAGCYTGTNVHLNDENKALEEVYKGCSTFDAESISQWPDAEGEAFCYAEEGVVGSNGEELDINTCKEFCKETDCNKYHFAPDAPEPPVQDDAFSCYTCQIVKDHLGNTIGAGEESCWTNNPAQRFLQECDPEIEDPVCITNMALDWAERGEQYAVLTRGCGTRKVTPGGQQCVEERLESHMFRDCVEYCDESKCNKDKGGVVDLHDTGNDLSCYQCQSGFNLDGTSLPGANVNCHVPDVSETIPTVDCPRYMNAACFTAATWRLDFDDSFEERDFKGCSGFKMESGEETCSINQIDEGSVTTCKSTCDSSNCNNLTPQKRRQCYVCDVTVDSDEKVLGVGQQSCFTNSPSALDLQYCPNDSDVCVTEMKADWDLWGAQTVTVRRACSSSMVHNDYCDDNGLSGNALYKDCFKFCADDACNSDFDTIAEEFSSPNNQEECYSCKFVELDNGNVEGNKACFDSPEEINAQHKCPIYANAGCYTGSTAFYDESGTVHEEVYKGCSSFDYSQEQSCSQFNYDDGEGNEFEVASCKQFCNSENDCNTDHISPDPIDVVRCFSCSTMKDHLGNILGSGTEECWSAPDISTLIECEKGSQCISELVVDWYAHGEQVAVMQRRCGPKPSQELPDKADDGVCVEQQVGQNFFKSCSLSCQNSSCNKQLEEVIDLHDNKNELECYACQYGYDNAGNIYPNSNKKCSLPSVVDRVDTIKCPRYLNAACFTAASWDFNWGDGDVEDDYKGCSAFRLEKEVCGKIGDNIGGPRRDSCKDTCDEDKCNALTPQRRLSCYTCEVTVNSLNETIGFGDAACFDNPGTRHLQECDTDETYCKTELLIDWRASGQQEQKVVRSCSKSVARSCSEGTTLNDHMWYKDCETTCINAGCNFGLEVAAYFDSGKAQESCYTCKFIENEDGSIDGNINCGEESELIGSGSTSCPKYANAGCYTGTNVHYAAQGDKLLEQVYKGCSTFTPKVDQSCYNITGVELDDNQARDYAICKEYCEGDKDCNKGHKKPDLPPSLSSKRCYQCQAIKDHVGNFIGQSEASCFSDTPDNEYLDYCENDSDVCVTDLFVQWMQDGQQLAGVRRRCADKATLPDECIVEQNGLNSLKECMVFCDENKCNSGLDEVMDLHDSGNEISCYNCQYGFDYTGNLLAGSDERCQLDSVAGELYAEKCPKYANAACFTASSWSYNGDKVSEDDHKGCSAFEVPPTERDCTTTELDGLETTHCRSTCQENECNSMTPEKRLSCYVCDVTVDSANATLGIGRSECFTNQPYTGDLSACPVDAPYCITEMEVTWTTRGAQTTRVKRGCSSSPAPAECKGATSDDQMYMFKDCALDCAESGCNYDLEEVATLFSSEQEQDSCLACSYVESDNGDVSGNYNCLKPESNSTSLACPKYANAGCYVGLNTHEGSDSVLLHEIYRGCSTFEYATDKLCVTVKDIISPNGNFDAETCKEFCTGADCNDTSSALVLLLSSFVLITLFL